MENKQLLKAKKFVSEEEWNNVMSQERRMRGSSSTKDKEFDRLGYKIIRNVCDPKLISTPVPEQRGLLTYDKKTGNLSKIDDNEQVPGSVARYYYPTHKEAHDIVRKRIEKDINEKLYRTYYYDRFYFPGQNLDIHSDRPACEISITIHCSSNLKDSWPICIKAVDGSVAEVDLKPGDGLIYKGCERPHWRLSMPGVRRNKIRKFFNMEEYYYHQIFFHYVLANGDRSHYAFDYKVK